MDAKEKKYAESLFGEDLKRLIRLSKNLNAIDMRGANGFYSDHSRKINETNERKFEKEASEILGRYGYMLYRQTDCRGVALYAIPRNRTVELWRASTRKDAYPTLQSYVESNYSTLGVAIY